MSKGRTKNIIERLPHFFHAEDEQSVLYQLVEVYSKMLDQAEIDLTKVMRSHWVNTADNEDSKGFDAVQKGDLDKIFSLYLQNLGGTALLRQLNRREGPAGLEDDITYRERIKGLINVIKGGASTRQGIVDVVAANLGIVGDSEEVTNAKQKIRIKEYNPQSVDATNIALLPVQNFVIDNPNDVPEQPTIHLRIVNNFHAGLKNIRIGEVSTNKFIQFDAEALKRGDVLSFFPGGTVLLNGSRKEVSGEIPFLRPSPNPSNWYIHSELYFEEGRFGINENSIEKRYFDFAVFNDATTKSYAETAAENTNFDYTVIEMEVVITKINPGRFTVQIPWDIPGYTIDFKITADTLDKLAIFELPQIVMTALGELINDSDAAIYQKDSDLIDLKKFTVAFTNKTNIRAGEYLNRLIRLIVEQSEKVDRFVNLPINPRNQIRYIVDKVKAAGVLAEVAFEKYFTESHLMQDTLIWELESHPFVEEHEMSDNEEVRIISGQKPYPDGIVHEMSDGLILSGVFDRTSFESLNTFF